MLQTDAHHDNHWACIFCFSSLIFYFSSTIHFSSLTGFFTWNKISYDRFSYWIRKDRMISDRFFDRFYFYYSCFLSLPKYLLMLTTHWLTFFKFLTLVRVTARVRSSLQKLEASLRSFEQRELMIWKRV